MILLAIDVGNTNMVFGVYKDKKLSATFRFATDKSRTADETGLKIVQYFDFAGLDIKKVNDVVIASVVPEVTETLKISAEKYLSVRPMVAGEDLRVTIRNLYDHPEQTGIDRLINAASAVKKYKAPVIIVDMGTATTVDAVNARGEFMGGVIFPGIGILAASLSEKTAKLPRVEPSMPESIIGTSTEACIRSGVCYGYTGAIERIIADMKREMREDPKVVATGGLGSLVSSCGLCVDVTDETLTLDGLFLLYEQKEKKYD